MTEAPLSEATSLVAAWIGRGSPDYLNVDHRHNRVGGRETSHENANCGAPVTLTTLSNSTLTSMRWSRRYILPRTGPRYMTLLIPGRRNSGFRPPCDRRRIHCLPTTAYRSNEAGTRNQHCRHLICFTHLLTEPPVSFRSRCPFAVRPLASSWTGIYPNMPPILPRPTHGGQFLALFGLHIGTDDLLVYYIIVRQLTL